MVLRLTHMTGELATAITEASLFQCYLAFHAISFPLREYDNLADLTTRSVHSRFVFKEQPRFDIFLSMSKIYLEQMARFAC